MATEERKISELHQVRQQELKIIEARRRRICQRTGYPEKGGAPAGRTLIGLAFSGGGIRSAATNLGVLQGLAKRGLLPFVDYLSTVSGGGYIGACFASLLSNRRQPTGEKDQPYQFSDSESSGSGAATPPPEEALFTTSWESFPFRDDHLARPARPEELTSQEQMEHIRTRASYLTPRPRYLSDSLMRAVGAVTFTTLIPLLWFLLLVTVATSLYMAVVSGLAPAMPPAAEAATKVKSCPEAWAIIKEFSRQPFVDFANLLELERGSQLVVTVILSGLTLGLLLPSYHFVSPAPQGLAGVSPSRREAKDNRRRFNRICWTITWALIGVMVLAWLLVRLEPAAGGGALLLLPSLLLAAAFSGSSLSYVIDSSSLGSEDPACWNKKNRATTNLVQGLTLLLLIFTLTLALLPGLIRAGNAVYILMVQAPLLLLLKAWLSGDRPAGLSGKVPKIAAKFKNWLLGLLVPLLVLLTVILVANLLLGALGFLAKWPATVEDTSPTSWLLLIAVPALLLALFSWGVDINKVSPHFFYRDRLAEAFLRTFGRWRDNPDDEHVLKRDNPGAELTALKRDNSEMKLTELHGIDKDGNCAGLGPYLLINATLNLTAAQDLKGFNRKAEVFTFSRLFVGSRRTGYTSTANYPGQSEKGKLKVARAMTISGAAASSVMGAISSPLLSFLCTILGVRLGYWLENIRPCHWRPLWRRLYKLLPTSGRLLQELSSHTDDRGPEIYLSDGGHSGDNLGILPLLQRRAKIIIAADAECDPSHSFDSFNSSLRQAYVDEGIKIRVALNDIYRREDGYSRKHYVVGRILYPDRPWQRSWLIILKNTMTKDEIAPLLNYKHKHPEFPHETTADQFFTEEQFESYRTLGRNAADSFCGDLFSWLGPPDKRSAKRDPWAELAKSCAMVAPHETWDDLLQAMWDAELAGFADPKSFQATLKEQFNDLVNLSELNEDKSNWDRKRTDQELNKFCDKKQPNLDGMERDLQEAYCRTRETWPQGAAIPKSMQELKFRFRQQEYKFKG
ncbi:patatin-like phospholipase family protein [Desulfurivibrio sp. D14AmB]|uniref:patatin-like phospholipase family protein n=1 Tax=Desulfurivibrio sp. D14AmB TaxID=3374370 RepID=UPI00376F122E